MYGSDATEQSANSQPPDRFRVETARLGKTADS
jgi:hypothetical protein